MADVHKPVGKCGVEPYCDECMFVALNSMLFDRQMLEYYQQQRALAVPGLELEKQPILGKLRGGSEANKAQDGAMQQGTVAGATDPFTGDINGWGNVPPWVEKKYPGCVFLHRLATRYHEVHHSANALRNRLMYAVGSPNMTLEQREQASMLGDSWVGSDMDTLAKVVDQDTIDDEVRAHRKSLGFWSRFYNNCVGKTSRPYPPLDPLNQTHQQMMEILQKYGFGAS
jgi:hypothetical protein